ncbi:thioredoxin domain-containing protein [Streptomyces sp. PCS3-D2]|uniref:thioredoxin family protein n=1 Tax=Streptomyces sp. PCS3-D2 TaxID=1460244 RepID=UPI0007C63B98|nr:thioredoxin domain-containing protein [Streptomyces sp. PCS3-D2]WKV70068.1 thioredoxin domain-containing protein [Streptomyces sp. PCS3-D2]
MSRAHFDEILADEARPVLVDFSAEWCGPCGDLAPELERFAQAEQDRLRVVSVDFDAHPELSDRYDIESLPTLVLFADGAPVLRLAGPDGLEKVAAGLDALYTTGPGAAPAEPDASNPAPPPKRSLVLCGTGPTVTIKPAAKPRDEAGVPEVTIAVPGGHSAVAEVRTAEELHALAGVCPDALDGLIISSETPVDLSLVVRLTGLSFLELDAPGLDAGQVARLSALRRLRHLQVEEPDDEYDDGALAFEEAIRALHVSLPDTEINGQWASRELLHLLTEEDQGVQEPGGVVEAALEARHRGEGNVTAYLVLTLPERAHAFTPGSTEGRPVSVTLPEGSSWRFVGEPVFPHAADVQVTGAVLIAMDLVGTGDCLDLEVSVQVCQDGVCFPPIELYLTCVPVPAP